MPLYKQIVTLDFETYFSKEYSLKLKEYNTSGYIRDPQFKTQCVGIQIDADDPLWIPDQNVAAALNTIDWANSALLCHHTGFDGLILSHHYGIHPAYYFDTLSMGRALHSNGLGAALDELANFYKLGNKLPNVLNETKGVRDLSPELMEKLGQYCAVDTELCNKLFHKMIDQFPQDELDLIDLTIRMFVQPVLQIDQARVLKELQNEQENKERLIAASGLAKTTLGSNPKFAEALARKGVLAPTKISPTTKKAAFAFAKNDLGFQELRQHPDEDIRNMVEARIAVKSTIGETRAQRFLKEGAAGSLPVYLSYYGAHTGRWSGGNKLNLQNLKRGGELRKSILAPEGHVLVVVDSAQIEARMLAWLADDRDLLGLFSASQDVYKYMAADIYGIPVDQVTKDQRFVGKVAVLGLGYNMGWKKFQWTLATGAMGPSVIMTDWECQVVVDKYRAARWKIAQLWKDLNDTLRVMIASERTITIKDKLIADCATNKVYLPNSMYLEYPGLSLHQPSEDDENAWGEQMMYFDYTTLAKARILGHKLPIKKGKKIYGGLFAENLTQALSRIVISDQMLAVENKLKITRNPNQVSRIVTMTHDEIVSCVPEDRAEDTLTMMLDIMKTPPAWCLDLPLGAEGGYAREYSK